MAYVIRHTVLFVGLFLFLSTPATGQITSGIRGTVVDRTGALIPGAQVSVVHATTGYTRSAVTDDSGRYTFTLLPVGTYKLAVEMPGFKRYHQPDITLSANEVAGINVTLEVGEISESVEVTGAAPLVNTQTSEVSTLIDSRQVVELPLNGRNPIQLATLATGVSFSRVFTALKGTYELGAVNQLTVNGNRLAFLQFNLDGGDYSEPQQNGGLNYPNPDAIQEFRFITNNYSAEFGKNPGGVMNVVTKSGTNEIHGSLWEFNRNSALAARNFFLPRKAALNQNQFGFTIGGPVVKNKFFLFGTAQWLKIRQGRASTTSFPPTSAERQGDLSATTTKPIIDPLTRKPFPSNIIPKERIDPVAAKLLNLVPLPNAPGGRFLGAFSEPTDNAQYLIKGDYHISDKNRLSVSLFEDNTLSTSLLDFGRLTLPLVNFTGDPAKKSQIDATSVIANHTYTFSPNLINNVRFGYRDTFWNASAEGRGPTLPDLTSLYPKFPLQDIPRFDASGRFTYAAGNFHISEGDDFQFSEGVSYIRGAHSLKFGGEIRYSTNALRNSYNNMGVLIANGQNTGDSMADFLLGKARGIFSNDSAGKFHQTTFAGYLQDDYKVTRNLTLNLGLRYEVANMWEPEQTLRAVDGGLIRPTGTFIPGQQSKVFVKAPAGLVFPASGAFGAGDPGVPNTIVLTDKNNWVPRFGFAWDVFGNGKTAIRGGYGVFSASYEAQRFTQGGLLNPPFFVNFSVPVTPSFVEPVPASLREAFPVRYRRDLDFSPFFPMALDFFDPSMINPYVQQFNFTIQQELPGRIAVQAGWVGNVTHHLPWFNDLNAAVYTPGNDSQGRSLSTLANTNQRRPFNQPFLPVTPYGPLRRTESGANSNYHSLQLQARKQFSEGSSFLLSYTWSKAIDEDSGVGMEAVGIQNDRRSNRGLSFMDQRHKFAASFIYQTPSVSRALGATNPLVHHVFDGWQLTGIAVLGSGFPLGIVTGRDNSLTGRSDRPNLVGNPKLPTDRPRAQLLDEYFNNKAFEFNAIGTFGNVGRGILAGPGSINVDFGVFKNVTVAERKQFQIRVEFFNLPNRANFDKPGTNLAAPRTFGKILSVQDGRIIQVGAKFIF